MSRSFGERISERWLKASQAFKETVQPPSIPPQTVEPQPVPQIVGWLLPVEGSRDTVSLQKLALDRSKRSLSVNDESFSVEFLPGSLVLRGKDGVRIEGFHGDIVTLGASRYRLSLLSARAFIKWFSALVAIFIGTTFHTQAQEPTSTPTPSPTPAVVLYESHSSDQNGLAQALYRSQFEASLLIPGLSEIDSRQVQASVIAEGKVISLPIYKSHARRTHYFIQVDTSSLCLARKKEELLNVELKRFFGKLSHDSLVTLTTFFGTRGKPNYATIFKRKTPNDLIDQSQWVTCQPHSESLNALEAMAYLKSALKENDTLEQTEKKTDWWRRVLITFTSGNVGITSEAESILKTYDLDFYPVVYSGVRSPVTQALLTRLTQMNEGEIFWWNNSDPLHFSERFPFLWTFNIFAAFPYQLEEKSYPLEINYLTSKAHYRVTSEVNYFQDRRAYFFYRLKVISLWTFGILLLTWIAFRIFNYYRVKKCPKTGLPLSHTWNASLFVARGRYPVLLVRSHRGYEKAHVVLKKTTRIKNGFSADLHLNPLQSTTLRGYVLRKKGYETFELSPIDPINKSGFAVNQTVRSTPVFLKSGDQFEWGEFTIQFLFPSERETPDANH